MKIEISKKTDNLLFSRKEISFSIQHAKSEPTPSRKQVKATLGAKLGADKELLIIRSIVSPMGAKASHGIAYLYKDKKVFERLAKEYLKKRDSKEPKEKKEEPKKEEAPVEEKPAESPKEDKSTPEEAPKEEKAEGELKEAEVKEEAPKEEEKPAEEEKKEGEQ